MFCEYCGKEIDDSAEICEFCGKSTDEDETADAVFEAPKIKTEIIGGGRVIFVLEMLLNVIVAACPFVKMLEITIINQLKFSIAGIIDAIDPFKKALDLLDKIGIDFDTFKTGNFGYWIIVILILAGAAMIAGYIFLALSIISLGKRQNFLSSGKKSAISLGCFLAMFALIYLAVFLLNSKISDKIHFPLSLFDTNVWFYIIAACAVLGIVLSFFYRKRAK